MLEKVKILLPEEKELSPNMRSMVELLVLIITLLANCLNQNGRNGTASRHRKTRIVKKIPSRRGTKKHADKRVTLQKVDDPDRNLPERLRDYEDDVLRFMDNKIVPFTNNLSENDIRITKVQQKISDCFRSIEGSKIFCRIRGYLSTCRKQEVSSSQAFDLLFQGKLPDFAD